MANTLIALDYWRTFVSLSFFCFFYLGCLGYFPNDNHKNRSLRECGSSREDVLVQFEDFLYLLVFFVLGTWAIFQMRFIRKDHRVCSYFVISKSWKQDHVFVVKPKSIFWFCCSWKLSCSTNISVECRVILK